MVTLDSHRQRWAALIHLMRGDARQCPLPICAAARPAQGHPCQAGAAGATAGTAAATHGGRCATRRSWEAQTVRRYNGPPMTLGNAAAANVRLLVWCLDCGHVGGGRAEPLTLCSTGECSQISVVMLARPCRQTGRCSRPIADVWSVRRLVGTPTAAPRPTAPTGRLLRSADRRQTAPRPPCRRRSMTEPRATTGLRRPAAGSSRSTRPRTPLAMPART
jgi:hypothetical protein